MAIFRVLRDAVNSAVSFLFILAFMAFALAVYAYLVGAECKSIGIGEFFKVTGCSK